VLFPLALVTGLTQVFYARGVLALVPSIMEGDLAIAEFDRLQLWSLLSNAASIPFFLARTYLAAAVFAAAPAMIGGERPGVREFIKGGWARFGWLLLVSVLVSTASSAGALFFLVGAVYVWARLIAAPVIAVTERAPIDRAFARSWSLTSGAVWRTVGFAGALWIFTVVLETAVDSPALLRQVIASVNQSDALFAEVSAGWKTLEGIFSALAAALVYPFANLAWFHYYLDLRARREGMDIVVGATRLAGESR
jgi:hypothetical protein